MHRHHSNGHQHQPSNFHQRLDDREERTEMQEVIQMCGSFDATKSTKGASKLRRDLINSEIANLRDLLPLPSSTRQRLSQLQLMALVCVYVRKANYFQQVFKRHHELGHPFSTPNIGFSKSLSGFLIMMTQNGKLLYISDNAAEYLGHSMEDLLIHGDSVYDIIDKADHGTVQSELLRSSNPSTSGAGGGGGTHQNNPGGPGEESRLFLCRMNVSRNARRQMRFGDQKVVLLQGRYLSYLPLCSRNEPVFIGTCTPVAMPETRECVVQGATNVFTSIHAMDMKFMHIDRNGEHYLGYSRQELGGVSWYQLIHCSYMREAQSKHRLISQSEQEKSCILLLKMETRPGGWVWVHCVLQVKDGTDSNSSSQPHPTQSIIVATNQVLSEREAAVMRANSWLYHYYTVQTKLQYGLAYPDAHTAAAAAAAAGMTSATQLQLQPSAAARLAAAAAYFPSPYSAHSHHHDAHSSYHHHPQIVQQSLASPHTNGTAYPTYPHPHYASHHPPHPHQLEGTLKGKESPLDFSLSSSSAFDPYSPYWTHHHPHHPHHHHHGQHGTSSNHQTHQYHQQNSTSSNYYGTTASNNNNSTGKSDGGGSTSSVSVSPSATSPQTWTLSISSSKGSPVHISASNMSPTTTNSRSSNSSTTGPSAIPRKKLKKGLHPQTSSSVSISMPTEPSNETLSAPSPPSSQRGGYSDRGGSGSVGVAAVGGYSPQSVRNRHVYKLLGNAVEEGLSAAILNRENENLQMMMTTCPLTPSPIWEGQTQRVPDLSYNGPAPSTHAGNGSGSNIFGGVGGRDYHQPGLGSGGGSTGTELIHCVPTYLPYSTGNPAIGGSPMAQTPHSHFPLQGYLHSHYTYGFAIPPPHPHYISFGDTTGSPNKENRLPPTPDSETGENEENKPIKWESL